MLVLVVVQYKWQPTPVLLPGESQERGSLVGCRLWGRTETDTTERLDFHFSLSCIGEGNGNPLQCSCLENPRDRGAWWAAVYGVAQSGTRLKQLSSSSSSSITVVVCCLVEHQDHRRSLGDCWWLHLRYSEDLLWGKAFSSDSGVISRAVSLGQALVKNKTAGQLLQFILCQGNLCGLFYSFFNSNPCKVQDSLLPGKDPKV